MECWLHSGRGVSEAVSFRPLAMETRVRVGFMVDKVAQWQVPVPVLLCPPVIIIALMLISRLFMSSTVYRVTYWHRRDITLTLAIYFYAPSNMEILHWGGNVHCVPHLLGCKLLKPYKVFGVLQREMKLKVRWVAESSRVFCYSSFLPLPAHPSASQMLAKTTATLSILLTPELCQRRRVFQVYVMSVSAPRCVLYRVIGWSATKVQHCVTECCLGERWQLTPGFMGYQFSAHVQWFRSWRSRCSVWATAWQPTNRGSIRAKEQEIYVFCKRPDRLSDPPSLLLLGTVALTLGGGDTPADAGNITVTSV
jgi:hypothetical protein